MKTRPLGLHLVGEVPAAPDAPSFALGQKGFRPFFLLAGVFAAALLPLWLAALFSRFDPGAYFGALYWHAHEMVFGFSVAVLAGFLLTAVGNWTQRETAVGAPLYALATLWLLGRVAVLFAMHLPRGVAAAVDLAFLPALTAVLARPLVATGNRRNYVMVVALGALWLCNLATHLDALGVLSAWRRRGSLVAVDVVTFFMVAMAGRVFPMFTRNATRVESIRNIPWLDHAAVLSMGVLTALSAFAPDTAPTSLVAMVTATLAVARAWHWGARHTARNPMLWILHAGYGWLCVGLAMRALAPWLGPHATTLATHALTAGAIGSLTLGMLARVALGHTGRAITATRTVALSFAMVTLAAVLRVLGCIGCVET